MPVPKKKRTANRPAQKQPPKAPAKPPEMKRARRWPEWITFVEWQASEMLAVVDLVNRLRLAEVKAGVSVDVPGFMTPQAAPLFDDEGVEHHGVRFAGGALTGHVGTIHADVRRALMSPDEIATKLTPAAIRKLREQWETRLREWGIGLYREFADSIRLQNIKRVAERRQKFCRRGTVSKAKMWQELADEFDIAGGERSIKRALTSDKAQGGITDVDPQILHYDPIVPPPPNMTADPFDPEQDKKRKKVS